MKNKNIYIMPMSGIGKRFKIEGFKKPKPLINVKSTPMFIKAAESHGLNNKWFFIVRKNRFANNYKKLINKKFKNKKIIFLKNKTDGQARTVSKAKKYINPFSNIIITSCDLYIEYNKKILEKKLHKNDFVVFVNKPNKFNIDNFNNFGWIKLKNEKILKSSCKSKVSNKPEKDWIIIGIFAFKNIEIFKKLLNNLFKSRLMVNNEFYLDTCVEIALKLKMKVSYIKVKKYISWGTPKELNNFNTL